MTICKSDIKFIHTNGAVEESIPSEIFINVRPKNRRVYMTDADGLVTELRMELLSTAPKYTLGNKELL